MVQVASFNDHFDIAVLSSTASLFLESVVPSAVQATIKRQGLHITKRPTETWACLLFAALKCPRFGRVSASIGGDVGGDFVLFAGDTCCGGGWRRGIAWPARDFPWIGWTAPYADTKSEQRLSWPCKSIALPTSRRVVQVSAGDDHSLVLTARGEVYSFGRSHNRDRDDSLCGALGHGRYDQWHMEDENEHKPTLIEALRPPCARAVQVAAGKSHSLVLLENGMVVSFGDDFYSHASQGHAGHGDDNGYPTVIAALQDTRATSVAAGLRGAFVVHSSVPSDPNHTHTYKRPPAHFGRPAPQPRPDGWRRRVCFR